MNDLIDAGHGWYLFRDADAAVRGLGFSLAAGGMFYIAVTDLVPIAQARH